MKTRKPKSKPIRIIKGKIKLLNARLPTAPSISIQSVSNNTMSRSSLSTSIQTHFTSDVPFTTAMSAVSVATLCLFFSAWDALKLCILDAWIKKKLSNSQRSNLSVILTSKTRRISRKPLKDSLSRWTPWRNILNQRKLKSKEKRKKARSRPQRKMILKWLITTLPEGIVIILKMSLWFRKKYERLSRGSLESESLF